MLKQIVFGIVLLAGLLGGSAWADKTLNKALFEVNTETANNGKACLVRGKPQLFFTAQNIAYKDCSQARTCWDACQCNYGNCSDSCGNGNISCVNRCIKDWEACRDNCN